MSFRRHYEKLPNENNKTYFGDFIPNDEYYGKFTQPTGLQYIIYQDEYCKGFDNGGMDLPIYNDGLGFKEVPHWERYGFTRCRRQCKHCWA